jgi:hypothetical protein
MDYNYTIERTICRSVIVDAVPCGLTKKLLLVRYQKAENAKDTCQKTIELALIFSLEVKDEASHPWDRTFLISHI